MRGRAVALAVSSRKQLLWWGTSGVSLSGAAGTQLIVPDAESSTVLLLEDGWTVAAERTTLELGRTGGGSRPRALRRCRVGDH